MLANPSGGDKHFNKTVLIFNLKYFNFLSVKQHKRSPSDI